jgi:hypothetical protein
MSKLFGGSVVYGIIGLLIASFVVGFVLSQLGYQPADVYNALVELSLKAWPIFDGIVNWALPYAAVGAMVVFPAWGLYYIIRFLTRGRS